MPSYVVKPERDQDAYVMWSTVVDCPVSTLGTRAETEAYLKDRGEWDPARLERADAKGSSARGDASGWFGWDDDEFLVTNCVPGFRMLKRTDLIAFCRAYEREDEAEMLRLTTECEDDE